MFFSSKRSWLMYVGGLLVTAPLLVGYSDCEQSSPAATCDTDCPTGQVVICGNTCAEPAKQGQPCSTELCSPNSLCQAGLSCMPDMDGDYSCQDLNQTLWAECDLNNDLCANHLFCRDNVGCGATDTFFDRPRCFNPVLEGGSCDSNFDNPHCLPCAPGLGCDGGVCKRGCDSDKNCGCDDKKTDYQCVDDQCRVCNSVGDKCDDEYQFCCDGSKCDKKVGDHVECCFAPNFDHACDSTDDCCSGVCAASTQGGQKVCQPCLDVGDSCGTDGQCCGASTCQGGTCKLDCKVNKDCTATSAEGECRKGKTSCDDLGQSTCIPGAPTAEICDEKDNDCDGDEDEQLTGPTCPEATNFLSATCQAGFKTSGHLLCEGEEPVECTAVPSVDFCAGCFAGSDCGSCVGQACSAAVKCAPGLRCGDGPSPVCMAEPLCPQPGQCWLKAAVGTCD